jgi:hypothetical protein
MALIELSPEQRDVLNTIPYFRDQEMICAVASDIKEYYTPENNLYITAVEVNCLDGDGKNPADTTINIRYEDASRVNETGPEESGVSLCAAQISLNMSDENASLPLAHAIGVQRAMLLSISLGVPLFMNKSNYHFQFQNSELQYVRKK